MHNELENEQGMLFVKLSLSRLVVGVLSVHELSIPVHYATVIVN